MGEEWRSHNIQDRMAQIRREVDETVDDIAFHARDLTRQLTDWRYYVRRYPWVVAAGAAAVGYLIVPKRLPRIVQPDPETLAALSREGRLSIQQKPTAVQTLASVGLNQLSTVVMRSAANYLADKLTASSQSRRPTE